MDRAHWGHVTDTWFSLYGEVQLVARTVLPAANVVGVPSGCDNKTSRNGRDRDGPDGGILEHVVVGCQVQAGARGPHQGVRRRYRVAHGCGLITQPQVTRTEARGRLLLDERRYHDHPVLTNLFTELCQRVIQLCAGDGRRLRSANLASI